MGIARALVTRPELVVLDEPTSMLDPSARADLLALLQRIQRETGTAYIFISHDLTSVARISHRIAIMYLGHIIEQAPTELIMGRQHHPYSRALLSAVLFADPRRAPSPYVIEGEIPTAINPKAECPLYSRCPIREDACREAIPPMIEIKPEHLSACRRWTMSTLPNAAASRALRRLRLAHALRLPLYIGRRVLFLVPQVLLISFITFALVRLLPGDPARFQLGPLAPEEAVEALRRKLHLDLSIPRQYAIWLKHALSGDFGTSWSQGTDVGEDLLHRIPVTLELIFLSLLVVFLVLVPLAIITASRTRNWAVRALRNVTFGYGMLAGALPDFLLALLLIFIFYTNLDMLPGPEGRLGILDTAPPFVTGSILIDTIIAGDWGAFWSALGIW